MTYYSASDPHQWDHTFHPQEKFYTIEHKTTQDDPSANYLINQKTVQKKQYDCRHNAKLLPWLHPGQLVLFLRPTYANSYIEGTITRPATTPRSYMVKAQGRVYCHNRQHIYIIDIGTMPILRPSMHQGNPILRPAEYLDTSITRPSFRTEPQIYDPPQHEPTKLSKQSHIPTL